MIFKVKKFQTSMIPTYTVTSTTVLYALCLYYYVTEVKMFI